MSNSKVITRAGKGSAISASENDVNLKSLAGISQAISSSTYTVSHIDQNQLLEFSAAGATVTLTDIATILAAIQTDSFKVYLRNLNATAMTVNRGGTNTIDGATSISVAQYETVCIQTSTSSGVWAIQSWRMKAGVYTTLKLPLGATIGEFSTDTTMVGNSDAAVPTEKAVKSYVDGASAALVLHDGVLLGTLTADGTTDMGELDVPDWANRIELVIDLFRMASATGASVYLGWLSGYDPNIASYSAMYSTGATSMSSVNGGVSASDGLPIAFTGSGTDSVEGRFILKRVAGSNKWVGNGSFHNISAAIRSGITGGSIDNGSNVVDRMKVVGAANITAGTIDVYAYYQ